MVNDPKIEAAQVKDIAVIYGKPALYADKVYSSFDMNNRIARITFCESYQGGPDMTNLGSFVVNANTIDSMVMLFQDLQQKFKGIGLPGAPRN